VDATIEHGTPGWYLLRRMSLGGRRARARARASHEGEAPIMAGAAYLRLTRPFDAGALQGPW
jgi:hypothetical protein